MLTILVPDFGAGARSRVARYHARVGDRLAPGGVLLDLDVDLSGGVMRDCPPLSTCRIVLREAARVRHLRPLPAADLTHGDMLAELIADPEGAADAPDRAARVTLTAVVHHDYFWGHEA